MSKISLVIVSKNDNYGGDLQHRAMLCLNNAVSKFDEVIYVDYASEDDISLVDSIRPQLLKLGNLKHIKITKSDVEKLIDPSFHNIHFIETVSRNIGIRRASNDWILNTNIDIMLDEFSVEGLDKNLLYTCNRKEVENKEWFKNDDAAKVFRFLIKFKDSLRLVPNANDENGNPTWDKNDPWSTIVCCGDFQLAHKDLINKMMGYEESMKGRSYADGNFMKKGFIYGNGTKIMNPLVDIFHLCHSSYTERKEGMIMPLNDMITGLHNFKSSENNSNWGFFDYDFFEETI